MFSEQSWEVSNHIHAVNLTTFSKEYDRVIMRSPPLHLRGGGWLSGLMKSLKAT